MTTAARTVARLAALALGAVLTARCSFNKAETPGCRADKDCGSGLGCVGGSCIQSGLPETTWAVEVVPTSDSSSAPTELPALSLGDQDPVLTAKNRVTVTVNGSLAVGSALADGSHVVATLRPIIPGRQDQQYEANWTPMGNAGTTQFALSVPAGAIGQQATLRILPLPPRDQAQPPVTTTVTLALPAIDVPISNNFVFVNGRLVTAQQMPIGGFIARAYQAGQLISNVFPIASNGTFRLAMPPEATGNAPNHTVAVDLAPADADSPNPRFILPVPVTGNIDLGDVAMPAVGAPNFFRFVVTDGGGQPVSDVIVTMQTTIPNGSGAASYGRSGRTDASGRVDLALLPGTAAQARLYDITAIPPAGSSLGIKCLSNFPITVGTAGSGPAYGEPPIALRIGLASRYEVVGTITSADGEPVAGVSIAATRSAVVAVDQCVGPALPISGSSDINGRYRLLLDPGTYQIDYDPPAGAPVPRMTESGVVVPLPDASERDVGMPAGALVRGTVVDEGGKGLGSAGVRFFQVICNGDDECYGATRVAPLLGAETHTDAEGNFSAVLPIR